MSLAEEVKPAPAMTCEKMGEACLQWQPLLIKHAFKYTRDRDAAYDLATDTIILAMETYESYDPTRGAVSTWLSWKLRSVAHHQRARRMAGKRGSGVTPMSLSWVDDEGQETQIDVAVPATQEINMEAHDAMRVIDALPVRERQVLLRRVYGDGLEEISEDLNVSSQRIAQLEERARARVCAAFNVVPPSSNRDAERMPPERMAKLGAITEHFLRDTFQDQTLMLVRDARGTRRDSAFQRMFAYLMLTAFSCEMMALANYMAIDRTTLRDQFLEILAMADGDDAEPGFANRLNAMVASLAERERLSS